MPAPVSLRTGDPPMSDAAANVPAYFADKQKKGLSTMQQAILRRAFEAKTQSIALEAYEVASATGLEKRDLVRTDRPTRGSIFSSRPIPGSKRTCRLTRSGRALAATLPPLCQIRVTVPVDLDEAKRLCRELATIVLDGPTTTDRFRAREILERLDHED